METVNFCANLDRAEEAERRRMLLELPPIHDAAILSRVAVCLGDPSPAVCEAAVVALVRCANETAAEAAATGLHSDESAERGYALDAITQLGANALPILSILVRDPDHDLRKYAVDALAGIGDSAASPFLLDAIHDPDVNVGAAAAEALGQIGLPDAIPALADAVTEGPDWVRIAALMALAAIGGIQALEAICSLSLHRSRIDVAAAAATAAGHAGRACPERAVGFLSDLLTWQEPGLRVVIVEALGEVIPYAEMNQVHRRALIAGAASPSLQSVTGAERAAAATCLGIVVDAHDGPAFAARLKITLQHDPDPAVRLASLQALHRMEKATLPLLSALALRSEEDMSLRLLALRLLAETLEHEGNEGAGHRELDAHLYMRMIDEEDDPALSVAALRALMQLDRCTGISFSTGVFDDEMIANDDVALTELAAYPVPVAVELAARMLAASARGTRVRVFEALLPVANAARITACPDSYALLATAAIDADWRIQIHAIRLLAACHQSWARELVTAACVDQDARVRVRAIQALANTALEEAEPPLLHHLLATDESGRVRTAAVSALARFRRIDAKALSLALNDTFLPVRRVGLAEVQSHIATHDLPVDLLDLAHSVALAATAEADTEIAVLGREVLLGLANYD